MCGVLTLLRAFRILEWRAYFGMFMYGYILSGSYSLLRFLILNILFFFYMSSIYLANNIYDVEGDRINPNKASRNPLTEPKSKIIFFKYTLVCMIAISCLIGFFFLNPYSYLVCTISLLIGIFYSVPPLRFKERFILDILSHSLFFGVLLLMIPFESFSTCLSHFPIMLSIAVYSMILEIRNEIEDYEYDSNVGYLTTAVRLGYHKSLLLLSALISIFIMISMYCTLPSYPYNIYILSISPLLLFLTRNRLDFRGKMRILDLYVISFLLIYLFSYVIRVS